MDNFDTTGDERRLEATGAKLKFLRTQRELSLATLASATGLSASFISLVENGKSDISLGRLVRILDALGVGHLGDFDNGELPLEGPITKRAGTLGNEYAGVTVVPISPSLTKRYFAQMVVYEPGGAIDLGAYHLTLDGGSTLYVLVGSILVELENQPPTILEVGDSMSFMNKEFRRCRNIEQLQTRVLQILDPVQVTDPAELDSFFSANLSQNV